ncbi:nitroreductase/quinone reductase family protein [Nocardiopsis potens]|uniref:nitroreductase/quinone reductase family protein n=1 Tax=Nocardiopsis potens TaxID=1246458 RepID=UPI00037652D9|nr:nitroreductase/quinone reductase family protein [Nocardiopsis potens]
MTLDFNRSVIEEFRANNGRVGGMFEGARLLLLTTTGARSGRPHTVPLGALPDGDRTLVIASAMGSDRHPAWYRNILADPEVTVEDGLFVHRARAAVLEGEERDRLFARAVEADPGWGEYQARTSRVLPVVALTTVSVEPPQVSGGEFLAAAHAGIRRELELIRAEVARSGPGALGAQLRANCLALCRGVHAHHTGEDTMMFPALAERHPEIRPQLDRFAAEHEKVAAMIAALKEAVSDPGGEGEAVLAEVDRLIADLGAHFDEEERWLTALLDGA